MTKTWTELTDQARRDGLDLIKQRASVRIVSTAKIESLMATVSVGDLDDADTDRVLKAGTKAVLDELFALGREACAACDKARRYPVPNVMTCWVHYRCPPRDDVEHAHAVMQAFDRAEVSVLVVAGLVPGLVAEVERLRRRRVVRPHAEPVPGQCDWLYDDPDEDEGTWNCQFERGHLEHGQPHGAGVTKTLGIEDQTRWRKA